MGSGAVLGLAPAPEYTFLIYVSLVGNYFKVLKAQSAAKAKGFSDVLYLGSTHNKYLEQVSSCNVIVVEEDSEKTGKNTSAGMYFLPFLVYRMDLTINALAMAKDPEAAFFKRLDGLQPCEVSELKAGTHIFDAYGDNFFKPASYIIEALYATSYEEKTHNLKDVEAQILRKRNELRQFEAEYRKMFLLK